MSVKNFLNLFPEIVWQCDVFVVCVEASCTVLRGLIHDRLLGARVPVRCFVENREEGMFIG
jgi:hypothetical protein